MSYFLGPCQAIASESDSSWFGESKGKTKGLPVQGNDGEYVLSESTVLFGGLRGLDSLGVCLHKPSCSLNETELNFPPPSVCFLPKSYKYRPSISVEFCCRDYCLKIYVILHALGIGYAIKYIPLNYV